MTVIARYESGWDPHNLGDQTLSHYGSRGLWQIFTGAHTPNEVLGHGGPTWTATLAAELEDPAVNAKAAKIVFGEQSYRAWSTYNNWHTTAAWNKLLNQVAKIQLGVVVSTHDKNYLDKLGNTNPATTAAIIAADAQKSCLPRLCLHYVRTWLRVPMGAPTAIAAWRQVPTHLRHSYYTPPPGVPVFWGGNGAGHVALSLGGNKVRSTDWPHAGQVNTVELAEIQTKWGLPYLGWTETLNGHTVYTKG